MFNLLGSIFGYGGQQPEATGEQNLQQVECAVTANQATQTQMDSKMVEDNESLMAKSTVTPSGAEWVIVDRSEEADRLAGKADMATSCTSMIESKHDEMVASAQPEPESETKKSKLTESTTTILGSFFEKNQDEDGEFNRKYKQANKIDEEDMMQTTNKDWLITPLPCLTSITASQRSIESDPLENLLIEHPSMSVFVAATSSQNSDVSFEEEEEEDQDVPMTLEEEVKQVVSVMAARIEPAKPSLTKSVSEKRKNHGSPSPNSSVSHSESPVRSHKRKGQNKKNKKQAAQQAAQTAAAAENKENNKENASALYLAETFKKQSNAARLESLLLNKNQMKRSNKNSVFNAAGAKAANAKHRKYHKLQQPACFQSSKPVF